jgi:hypothetical protein
MIWLSFGGGGGRIVSVSRMPMRSQTSPNVERLISLSLITMPTVRIEWRE